MDRSTYIEFDLGDKEGLSIEYNVIPTNHPKQDGLNELRSMSDL